MKYTVLFLTGFFLFYYKSSAQQAWTLQQCINYALEHNIQVKQADLNRVSARENYEQSYATMLPSLNAGASQNYYYGRSIDPYTNSFTTNEVRSNSFYL